MVEYIKRDDLLQDISETVVFTVRKGTPLPNAEMRGANKVIDRIKSAPPADVVEVRHGEWWIQTDIADYPYGTCSVCGYVEWDAFPRGDTPNYCPNCGAKMN